MKLVVERCCRFDPETGSPNECEPCVCEQVLNNKNIESIEIMFSYKFEIEPPEITGNL